MPKKIHNPKAQAPTIFIPAWLSQVPVSKNLSFGAKMLYGRLAQWSNSKGQVHRSVPLLAKEIGIGTRQCERLIKELRDNELIATHTVRLGGENYYIFYDHPWMHEPIIEELCYATNPPLDSSVPPVNFGGTPPSNLAGININKIKVNKKTNSVSCETQDACSIHPFISFWNSCAEYKNAHMKKILAKPTKTTKKLAKKCDELIAHFEEMKEDPQYMLPPDSALEPDFFHMVLKALIDTAYLGLTNSYAAKLERFIEPERFEDAILFLNKNVRIN